MSADKKPWEGEKPPAPPEPARTPPPPPPVAKPAPAVASAEAGTSETLPANLDGVGVDEEATAAMLDTVNGDQAPLELINMVSSGVPMAEARARLNLRAPEPETVEDEEVEK